MPRKKVPPKILFVAEAVTSAHLFRPLWMAQQLAKLGYEVHLATTQDHPILSGVESVNIHKLKNGITSESFLKQIRKGQVPFDNDRVNFNLKQDFEILKNVEPDFVIDDFRITLSMATEKLNVPHITLNNISWSPYYKEKNPCVPDIELIQKLGVGIGGFLFNTFKGVFERNVLKPFNRQRKQMGLHEVDSIHHLYNGGAQTGYLDIYEVVPQVSLPPTHHFLGPILFSYPCPLPKWWPQIDKKLPIVYLSLGSSGRNDLIPRLVNGLNKTNLQIIVSTSGQKPPEQNTSNVFYASYLPDHLVLENCNLYVGNGGSGGLQQALSKSVPSISLPDNYDQWLYSTMYQERGLTKILRPSNFKDSEFINSVEQILDGHFDQVLHQSIASKLTQSNPVGALQNLMGLSATSLGEKPLKIWSKILR